MQFKGVTIFLNLRCAVQCPTCNAGCTPDRRPFLSLEALSRIFETLGRMPVDSFCTWTGGEPFESFPELMHGLKLSNDINFCSEILTSGSWFGKSPEFLDHIASYPNVRLRISLDAEHQKRIPLESIDELISACLEKKIDTGFTIREIPGARPDAAAFERHLAACHPELWKQSRNTSRLLHKIPTMPLPGDDQTEGHSREASHWTFCRFGFASLVIGPDALLYPCCGLVGLETAHVPAYGDFSRIDPENLDERIRAHTILQTIRFKGPAALISHCVANKNRLSSRRYVSECHLCREIFSQNGG